MRLEKEELKRISIEIIDWISNNMRDIGAEKAVIGISGGKDSTVTAALCVKALGKENVHGLIMPAKDDEDLSDAIKISESLEIEYHIINIKNIVESFHQAVKETGADLSKQTRINIPPRVRMTMLYAYAQSINKALVINTSNLSEDWVGYATIYGDTTGAFSPLATLTSDEVIQVGEYLGVKKEFLVKPPADGLTGKTDEEVFGFSYEILNTYIRKGIIEDKEIKNKIDNMHLKSRFKFKTIPMYNSGLKIFPEDIDGVYDFDS